VGWHGYCYKITNSIIDKIKARCAYC